MISGQTGGRSIYNGTWTVVFDGTIDGNDCSWRYTDGTRTIDLFGLGGEWYIVATGGTYTEYGTAGTACDPTGTYAGPEGTCVVQ